jgi:hypothetical protein
VTITREALLNLAAACDAVALELRLGVPSQ